jgi:hypothetical protein
MKDRHAFLLGAVYGLAGFVRYTLFLIEKIGQHDDIFNRLFLSFNEPSIGGAIYILLFPSILTAAVITPIVFSGPISSSILEYLLGPLLLPFNSVLWMLPAVLAMRKRKNLVHSLNLKNHSA